MGVGVTIFLTKPPKGTSLADFTRFEPLRVRIRSGVFPLGVTTKKGTLQKVTERYYIVLYSFIAQVDRTQLILHTNSFAYIYKVHVFGYTDCTYYKYYTCNKYQA